MKRIQRRQAVFLLCAVMLIASTFACGPTTVLSRPTPTFQTEDNTDPTDTPEEPEEEPTEEPTEEDGDPTPTDECTYDSVYIADVTIPDGTVFEPGDTFTKTWRIKNNGCKVWEAGTKLLFVQGDLMGGPTAGVDVPQTAVDGQQDLSVNLAAPGVDGTYRGYWQLKAPDGTFFGNKIYVDIVVQTQGAPQPSNQPDLVITNIVPGGDFLDEEPFHFTVTIQNQGGADSAPTDIGCELVNAGAGGTQPLPAIPAGGSTTVQCGYTADFGDYTFRATADMAGLVTESNELNNIREYSFTVSILFIPLPITLMPLLFPDLIVGNVQTTPTSVTVTVSNVGAGNANESHVRCIVDYAGGGGAANGPAGVEVPAISAGGSATVDCLTGLSGSLISGSTVEVIVDCQGEYFESDETNNEMFLTVP